MLNKVGPFLNERNVSDISINMCCAHTVAQHKYNFIENINDDNKANYNKVNLLQNSGSFNNKVIC